MGFMKNPESRIGRYVFATVAVGMVLGIGFCHYDVSSRREGEPKTNYVLPSDFKRAVSVSETRDGSVIITYEDLEDRLKTGKYGQDGLLKKSFTWQKSEKAEGE